MNAVNRNEITIFGIKRCGNHAIIHWLIQHMGQQVVHLNDVTTASPYDGCTEINVKGLPLYQPRLSKQGIRNLYRQLVQHYDLVEYSRKDQNVNWKAIRLFSPKDCLIISYENSYLDSDAFTEYTEHHDAHVGHSERIYRAIILRDAYNLVASLFHATFLTDEDIVLCVELYKQFAGIFLDKSIQEKLGIICINFNEWFNNSHYRINLACEFGVNISGEPFQRVPSIGGGSSFDGVSKDGKAQEMKIFERWKIYRNDPKYRAIFRDTQLTELSNAIFGQIVPYSWQS